MRRLASSAILAVVVVAALVVVPWTAQADPMTTWTAGPDGAGDNTYDGFIDAPANGATIPTGSFNVTGWFVDSTAEGWAGADDVEVWLGTMDGGGRLLGKIGVGQNRPDVAAALGDPFKAASGFGGTIPPNSLAVGPQTLSIYVHTPGKGWWFKQVNVTASTGAVVGPVPAPTGAALPIIAIEKPKDGENVLTKSDYDITGYALDKNANVNQGIAGSGVDRVQLYMDGERDKGVFLGDADLGINNSTAQGLYGGQFQSAGWKLTFRPTNFHVNTHLLYAYARSAVSGKEDLAVRYFAIRDQ